MSDERHPSTAAKKVPRVRSRTGCYNCRRRRKKCSGQRPVCESCESKREHCEWGLKLSFRSENNHSVPIDHPSMKQGAAVAGRDATITFCDITGEVIRDYKSENQITTGTRSQVDESPGESHGSVTDMPLGWETPGSRSSRGTPAEPLTAGTVFWSHGVGQELPGCPKRSHLIPDSPASQNSTDSYNMRSAAVQLLDLGGAPFFEPPTPSVPSLDATQTSRISQQHDTPLFSSPDAAQSEASGQIDGIFLPGSAYLELHSTLRTQLFDIARSEGPTRLPSPDVAIHESHSEGAHTSADQFIDASTATTGAQAHLSSPQSVELTQLEEYGLLKNWVDEIAPWLDKFDNDCIFGRCLPALAQEHPHLRYSMLACSARQQERKYPERSSTASLGLYQEAIHQLIPQLHTRSTAVVASCVVLCVLEMMCCSPQMWRRHLDGCACLIQSVGINGFSATGIDRALFWCFARMDVCSGLISSQRTLIPVDSWSSETSLESNAQLYLMAPGFHYQANYSVFLCAHVVELFASDCSDAVFARQWSELFTRIEDWFANRPSEMMPILELNAPEGDYSRPFPIILFSNPAAISGNQLYHTAALLMLQKKPRGVSLRSKTRSILWHARRICAISISNTHHGCWTNSIQPLWIAGQVMSHRSEHQAILDIYATIERETGFSVQWRAEDLKAYWGELEG